jgi:hypothetical protein
VKSSNGVVMDGFVRGTTNSGGNLHSKKSYKITEKSNLISAKPLSGRLKSTAQNVHHRAQRSQTLMRSVVRKPEAAKQTTTQTATKTPSTQTANLDPKRLTRAKATSLHSKVRRFGHVNVPANTTVSKNIPEGEVVTKPQQKSQSKASVINKPLPSMVTSASHHQLERLLDQALTSADAHKKALSGRLPNQNLWQKVKNTPRWLSIGVSVFAVVLLTGFISWHKVPQVAVRVAATRAHVNAHVPSYTPSGFSFTGPVHYNDGSVTIKFKADTSKDRTFTLTQKNSNMSNKSLADTAIPQNSQVQTSQIGGTTVYIYGNSNDATWVNHGIQYTINDKASLNSDQLLKIADSL